MGMVFKSKQILSATLVIALGAAVAVNWYYRNAAMPSDETSTTIEQVSGNLGDSLYVGATTVAMQPTDTTDTSDAVNGDDYFASAKLKRTQSHDEIIDNIEKIIKTDEIDSDTKKYLETSLYEYQRDLKVETDTENLITAKISGECLVIINEGKCQVILQKNTINEHVILQITEIIEKNTKISAENLTIIELK